MNPKQRKFCIEVIKGKGLGEAYASVYKVNKQNGYRYGSLLAKKSEIKAEIERLQNIEVQEMRKEFRNHSREALERLLEIMRNEKDTHTVYMACKDILDRAGYKPVEKMQVNEETPPVVLIRTVKEEEKRKVINGEGGEV